MELAAEHAAGVAVFVYLVANFAVTAGCGAVALLPHLWLPAWTRRHGGGFFAVCAAAHLVMGLSGLAAVQAAIAGGIGGSQAVVTFSVLWTLVHVVQAVFGWEFIRRLRGDPVAAYALAERLGGQR